ncbi:MAG: aldo/keto reductase [Candidatus Latescibacteria bacterium]|nr:aldo/keto reductase [Candidatus Latescibacterota bacterium]
MAKKSGNVCNRKEFLKRTGQSILGAGVATFACPAFIKNVRAAANVEYRALGSTGIKVTSIGLGGSRTNEPSVLKRAFDMGVNFIDTGRMYAQGRNEEMIGKVIKDFRKDIVIQSKIDQKIQDDAQAMGKSIDDSLKALQTDYIDIMIIRGATSEKAVNNPVVREAFSKAKEAGKIRLCGFSSHSGESHKILRMGVDAKFYDVAMIPYNHAGNFRHTVYGIYSEWDQEALENEFKYAVSQGMSIIAMKTCSGGPLVKGDETRGSYQDALKWNLRNKDVSVMAVGMASFREVAEDVGAMS